MYPASANRKIRKDSQNFKENWENICDVQRIPISCPKKSDGRQYQGFLFIEGALISDGFRLSRTPFDANIRFSGIEINSPSLLGDLGK
jgi:hypothetical protein